MQKGNSIQLWKKSIGFNFRPVGDNLLVNIMNFGSNFNEMFYIQIKAYMRSWKYSYMYLRYP